MKLKWIASAVVVFLFSFSCTEDKIKSPASCDVTGVTFSKDVLPIIQKRCYSCHGNGQNQGGVNLDGHAKISTSPKLYASIAHLPGAEPMPIGGSKLPQCEIDKIKAWLDAGAPNN